MINIKNHPITIMKVLPKELSIKAHVDPDVHEKYDVVPYSITSAHSDYDSVNKLISVGIKLETDKIDEAKGSGKVPFSMIVELVAQFKVDEEKFPVQKVIDWAKRNAPLIIYPYLREHVYSLTVRSGFMPMLLPLVEVPTIKIEQPPKVKQEDSPTPQ